MKYSSNLGIKKRRGGHKKKTRAKEVEGKDDIRRERVVSSACDKIN